MEPSNVTKALGTQFKDQSNLALLFSLRHDFPTEWSAFVNGKDNSSFTTTIHRDYFPYFTQNKQIAIADLVLYNQDLTTQHTLDGSKNWVDGLADKSKQALTLTIDKRNDPDLFQFLTDAADAQVFLIVRYSLM